MSSPSATGAAPDGSRARPAFERLPCLLQGGGALGAYQAGVYQALAKAEIRFSVGDTNIKTGNLTYFDNTTHKVGPAHVMAGGSLPPGFPATEVDGEFYSDGSILSNTPLQWVLDARPREGTLAFQVDLWSACGELPRDMIEVDTRQNDIRYSSAGTPGRCGR